MMRARGAHVVSNDISIARLRPLAGKSNTIVVSDGRRAPFGRQFRTVRDDEIAASLAGIPVARTQILAFMVSAACAGLGGGLLALVVPTVGPGGFTLALSIQLLVAIVIGGMGSITGERFNSQASATCPGVAPLALASLSNAPPGRASSPSPSG